MIAIIGSPAAELAADGSHQASGLGVRVARALVRGGERVEMIGRIGADQIGEELTLSLARDGIGHVALLRDAALTTPVGSAARGIEIDRGDAQLGLRYLTSFSAVLLIDPASSTLVHGVTEESAYGGAHLIVVADAELENEVVAPAAIAAPGTPSSLRQVAPPIFVARPRAESPEFDAYLAGLLASDEVGSAEA
jgi:hypothetical protein